MAAMGLPVTNAPIDNRYDTTLQHPVNGDNKVSVEKKKEEEGKKRGINLEDIKKNPTLAKMLIKAAKTIKQNKNPQRGEEKTRQGMKEEKRKEIQQFRENINQDC